MQIRYIFKGATSCYLPTFLKAKTEFSLQLNSIQKWSSVFNYDYETISYRLFQRMANMDWDTRGTSSPTRPTLGGFQNFFYTILSKPFTWESPHVMISKTVLDSGFQVLYSSSLGQWNLDSRFQSLVGLRIPWAVFWIPKPIRFRIHYPVRWRISYYYMAESVFAMHHACTRSSWRASLSFAVFFQRPTKER